MRRQLFPESREKYDSVGLSGIINWLLADMTRLVGRRTGTVYQVLNKLLTMNF